MQRDGWQSKQTRPHKDSGTSQLGDEYFAMVVKAGNVGFDTQLDAKPKKEKDAQWQRQNQSLCCQ